MKTIQEIYDHIYDPNIGDFELYTRESLCVWIRSVLYKAITQGFLLGRKHMRDKALEAIKSIHE